VLAKCIRFHGKIKYLIIINYIEREVSKILKAFNQNEVFEQYEVSRFFS